MKRLLLAALMCIIILPQAVSAAGREKQTWDNQPYKYEIRVGWGMPSDAPVAAWRSDPTRRSNGRLASIYGPAQGGLYSTGGFSAEFGLNFRKWFTLALQTSFCGVWSDVYGPDGEEWLYRKNGVVFNLAPQARFNWVKRPVFRMYSSVGVGLTVVSYAGCTSAEPSFQFVPFGMAVGKDVFFFCEAGGGTGSNFLGYHLGLGYRF